MGDAAGGPGTDGVGGEELDFDWHTVSKEVNRWGEALLEADRNRVGIVEALGLDENLFLRQGPWRRMWITTAVDIRNRRLIDVFSGKDAKGAIRWLLAQPAGWREKIRWATLDLSGAYRAAYNQALPHAVQIADPFHVVRLANLCLDRVRRRVQEEALGHRGRKGDDLYRIRKPAHPRPRTAPPPQRTKTDRPPPSRRPPRGGTRRMAR